MFHRKRGRHGREEKATPRPRFPIPEPGAPSATFASLAKFNEKCCYEVSGPPAGCGGTSAHRAAHPLQNAQRVGHPRGSSRLKDAPPAKISRMFADQEAQILVMNIRGKLCGLMSSLSIIGTSLNIR